MKKNVLLTLIAVITISAFVILPSFDGATFAPFGTKKEAEPVTETTKPSISEDDIDYVMANKLSHGKLLDDFTYNKDIGAWDYYDDEYMYIYDDVNDELFRFNPTNSFKYNWSNDLWNPDNSISNREWYAKLTEYGFEAYAPYEEYDANNYGYSNEYQDNDNVMGSIKEGFDSLNNGMSNLMLENAMNYEYIPPRDKSDNWRYEIISGKWFFNNGDAIEPAWREEPSYGGPENYEPYISYQWYYNDFTNEWVFFNSDDGEFYDWIFPYTEFRLRLVSPDYYEYTGLMTDLGNGWRKLGNFNVFQDINTGIWYKYTATYQEWDYNDSGSNIWHKCDDTFVPPIDL